MCRRVLRNSCVLRRPVGGGIARWLLILSLLAGSATASSPSTEPSPAEDERGTPFLRVFGQRDYDSHPQNWALVQDSRGVLFVGNSDGILEFDGSTWRRTRVENGSIARSLARSADGTLYVGAVGDLGRLRPDARGSLVYESLVEQLPTEHRAFSDVWRTLATPDAVFFWTPGKLFRWRDEGFRVFEVANQLIPAILDDRLVINLTDRGLHALVGDVFEPLPGGATLAGQRIDLMLPGPQGGLLLGSRDGSLFTLGAPDDGPPRLERFSTEVQTHLDRHQLYSGSRLPDGAYALGTMTGGVVILEPDGRLRHRLGRAEGLPDNSVWATAVDRQGGLWLGLNRGLVRIETRAPITVFDDTSGLHGTVEALVRHRGRLHAGTSTGVYRLEASRFVPVSEDFGLCWSLLSIPGGQGDGHLLAGAYDGIFELSDSGSRRIHSERNAFTLLNRKIDPSQVVVGQRRGLALIRRIAGQWTDSWGFEGIEGEVRDLAEDADGWLWVGTSSNGVYRLRLDDEGRQIPDSLSHWGVEQGLPVLQQIKILPIAESTLFATPNGIHSLEAGATRITPSPLLGSELASSLAKVNRLAKDPEGNLWLTQVSERSPVFARWLGPGRYETYPLPFDQVPGSVWLSLLPERDGVAWFGGPDGLYRYQGRPKPAEPLPCQTDTLIREVSRRDGTLLFGGFGNPRAAATPTLPFDDNDLSFHYALTSHGTDSHPEYRRRLVGLDETWSPWSSDGKVEYHGLKEGRYRFEVEGRDLSRNPGLAAHYEFRIEPPWFRSRGFRLVSILALGALVWAVYGLLVGNIRRTQRRLAEDEQKTEREQLIAMLQAKNEDLERFSYTVSHDLKAPLVTIRGFLGLLGRDLDRGRTQRLRSDLDRIDTAAAKMQERVEKLLQLSRLGHRLSPTEPVDLAEVAAEALELVSGELEAGGVEVVVEPDLPTLHCDRGRVVEAIQNLLQNAGKYMGDQESPRIVVGARREASPAVITVRDNGLGIEPQHHEAVFQLFQRVEHSVDGTGIGLALVRGICEAHGGTAWVESAGPGRGSTFCLTLGPADEPRT